MAFSRVEYLIEDYMVYYRVSFEEAVKIMIQDLNDALKDKERDEKGAHTNGN